MKTKLIATFICVAVTCLAILPSLVLASNDPVDLDPITETGLSTVREEVTLYQGGEGELEKVIPRLINIVMSILGIIAVIIILIGGFMWMTAAGNEERVDKAKKVLVAGVIGLLIVIAAYAISSFIVRSLYEAVQANNATPEI